MKQALNHGLKLKKIHRVIEFNQNVNKPIYLGLSILEISKILMSEFWYDYMKPRYDNNVKLCYMDTNSFIMDIKTNDFYKDIANDVKQMIFIKI